MSISATRGRDGVPYALVRGLQDTRLLAQDQCGTGTLASGTATISGLTLLQGAVITVSMRDPGAGAITAFAALDVPVGTRTATQFVVNAIDNTKATIATAVCTFDYRVTHSYMHGSPMLVTSGDAVSPAFAAPTFPANASSLATSITLANFVKYICLSHALDTCAHKVADTTNRTTLAAIADASDLASVILVANGVKAFMNAHFTQSGVHVNNDTFNTIATANATDQSSSNTLLNALKSALALHIAHAPGGESVLLLPA